MLTGTTRQILPVTSDSATYYVALQPASNGPTNYDYVGTTITYNASRNQLSVAGSVLPSANNAVSLGTASSYWSTVYGVTFVGTSVTAQYADLAERYRSDADYEAGTVVDFGGDAEITLSRINGSQYIAGVISTNPAYLMNDVDPNMLPVALMGRVPCKVTGPIEKGAMLVSNGDGSARMERYPKVGSVLGKALESFSDGTGVIEVVVGRL